MIWHLSLDVHAEHDSLPQSNAQANTQYSSPARLTFALGMSDVGISSISATGIGAVGAYRDLQDIHVRLDELIQNAIGQNCQVLAHAMDLCVCFQLASYC